MNLKVEIKGIDTSKLPKLENKKLLEMIKQYKNGEKSLKEEIVNSNLRLVLSIVNKFNNRGEQVDDIFQVGVIGLLKAIDNFNTELDVQFSTYAVPMIIGEIKRFLRDTSVFRITRSVRDLAYQISKIKEEYIKKENRDITIKELCEILKKDKEDIIIAIDSMAKPISLNEIMYNDSGDTITFMEKIKDETDEMGNLLDKIATKEILEYINEEERDVIIKRYFKDKTQSEIAKELGISQAQISRMEKAALLKMKNKI